jgi:hypothetical protein
LSKIPFRKNFGQTSKVTIIPSGNSNSSKPAKYSSNPSSLDKNFSELTVFSHKQREGEGEGEREREREREREVRQYQIRSITTLQQIITIRYLK